MAKDKGHDPRPTQRAREFRNNPTPAERRLWSVLSNRQLGGVRFNRQVKVPPFTLDLCARTPKLVIELDGGQHGESIAYDERRKQFLEERGYKVIRFWNHEVMTCLDDVVRTILGALASLPPPALRERQARSAEGRACPNPDKPSPGSLRSPSPPAKREGQE